MKKNLVIAVLAVAVLCLGYIVLDEIILDKTAPSVATTSVVAPATRSLAPVPASYSSNPSLVPVVPVSEVDQKLEKLGFRSSSEVHRVKVSQ